MSINERHVSEEEMKKIVAKQMADSCTPQPPAPEPPTYSDLLHEVEVLRQIVKVNEYAAPEQPVSTAPSHDAVDKFHYWQERAEVLSREIAALKEENERLRTERAK
jgi:hypothetical protein